MSSIGRPFKASFWQDRYVRSLDRDTKDIYLFLITSHRLNISGVYEITETEIARHALCDESAIKEVRFAISNLRNDAKILYEDGWVFLLNRVKHQSFNANMKIGLVREINNIIGSVPEGFVKGLETLSQSLSKDSSKLILILKPKLKLKPNGRLPKNSQRKSSRRTTTPTAPATTTHFDAFWDCYPRKVDRKKALAVWGSKDLDAKVGEIIEFLRVAVASDAWSEKKFIPYPTTFLNNERWKDTLADYESKPKTPPPLNLNEPEPEGGDGHGA